jgi:hypothetical protein
MAAKAELVIAHNHHRLATADLELALARQALRGSHTRDMRHRHRALKVLKVLVEPWNVLRILRLRFAPEENSVELAKPRPEPLVLEYWLMKVA